MRNVEKTVRCSRSAKAMILHRNLLVITLQKPRHCTAKSPLSPPKLNAFPQKTEKKAVKTLSFHRFLSLKGGVEAADYAMRKSADRCPRLYFLDYGVQLVVPKSRAVVGLEEKKR